MNVHLRQNFVLPAAVYSDDQLLITNYNINIEMVTVGTNITDLDTASKRIDLFMYEELSDAVFVDQSDTERNSVLALLGMNLVTIPGPPVDQLIGIMLSCKLNAITEGRVDVVETAVSSDRSNGLWFVHQYSQTVGPFEDLGWWYDTGPSHNNIVFDDAELNVVKVSVNPWLEHGLAWSSTGNQPKEAKIIVGNFNKKHDT
jgi:hypothetical protein